jgi:hypothetical protein
VVVLVCPQQTHLQQQLMQQLLLPQQQWVWGVP